VFADSSGVWQAKRAKSAWPGAILAKKANEINVLTTLTGLPLLLLRCGIKSRDFAHSHHPGFRENFRQTTPIFR
jgi:hypothetical protein